MSIKSLLAGIPSTRTEMRGEVVQHPANDPAELGKRERQLANELIDIECHIERVRTAADRDIEDIQRERDELLEAAYAKRKALVPQINETRKKIGAWASSHGVNGEAKLESEE